MMPRAGGPGRGRCSPETPGQGWCPRRGSLGLGGGVRLRLTLGRWERIPPEQIVDRGARWEG